MASTPSSPREDVDKSRDSPQKRRRPHTKSRNGCIDCRRRRVKCDEKRPTCASCRRRGVYCEYSQAGHPRATRSPASRALTSTSLLSPPVSDLAAPTPTPSLARDVPQPLHTPSSAPPDCCCRPPPSYSANTTNPTSTTPAATPGTPSTTAESSSWCSAVLDTGPAVGTSIGTGTGAAALKISDLALLHHWTVCASTETTPVSRMTQLWQVTFPRIGLRHPFVMHGLLSIAALHIAYLERTRSPAEASAASKAKAHLTEATHHHTEALRGFRHEVNNITKENSEALVVWSMINLFYVFAVSNETAAGRDMAGDGNGDRDGDGNGNGTRCLLPRQKQRDKDRILGVEWIPMMRGFGAVLAPAFEHIKDGPLDAMMRLDSWDGLDPDDTLPGGEELRRAEGVWTRSAGSADAETYAETLWLLRRVHAYIGQFDRMDQSTLDGWGCNRASAGPMVFIHFAPKEYFTLLNQRQPAALVLFGFFGALLHGLDRFWFMEGWGKDIVHVVDELLGAYWRPWISWPLQVVAS